MSAGKYASDIKNDGQMLARIVETRYDITSISKVGLSLDASECTRTKLGSGK